MARTLDFSKVRPSNQEQRHANQSSQFCGSPQTQHGNRQRSFHQFTHLSPFALRVFEENVSITPEFRHQADARVRSNCVPTCGAKLADRTPPWMSLRINSSKLHACVLAEPCERSEFRPQPFRAREGMPFGVYEAHLSLLMWAVRRATVPGRVWPVPVQRLQQYPQSFKARQ